MVNQQHLESPTGLIWLWGGGLPAPCSLDGNDVLLNEWFVAVFAETQFVDDGAIWNSLPRVHLFTATTSTSRIS